MDQGGRRRWRVPSKVCMGSWVTRKETHGGAEGHFFFKIRAGCLILSISFLFTLISKS